MTLTKVISGGQTGADQAGLIAGLEAGFETGGTAPSNFYTDNGNNYLLSVFGLTHGGDYRQRTIRNVKDSDGTLILARNLNSPGCTLTRNHVVLNNKQLLEIDVQHLIALQFSDTLAFNEELHKCGSQISEWIQEHQIEVLNVAGNREFTKTNDFVKLCILILRTAFSKL